MAQSDGQAMPADSTVDHLGVDEHARERRRRDRKRSNDAQSRKLIAGVLAALFGGAIWIPCGCWPFASSLRARFL